MGIRCTVMGHDYGESKRTEKREERGNEMVVTVHEYRECRRCDHRKTVSENTEVRSEETTSPDDAESTGEMTGETDRATHSRDEEDATGTAPDSTTDATTDHGVTATEETEDAAFDHGTIDATTEDDGTDEGPTAAEDDGIILEDETDDGRSPGEWPDAAKEKPDETTHSEENDSGTGGDWPTPDAEDQGYDAKPGSADSDDDVEFLSDLADEGMASTTGESNAEETAAGGESPSQSDATSDIARDDTEPIARRPPPSSGAVLSCPRCGHTTPSRASSLRPGDICPNCVDGYLTEREE